MFQYLLVIANIWGGIIDNSLNLKYLNLCLEYLWEAIFVSSLLVEGFLLIKILKIIIPSITDFILEHLKMLNSSTVILQISQFSCFVFAVVLMISSSLNFSQILKSLSFASCSYNIAFSQLKSFLSWKVLTSYPCWFNCLLKNWNLLEETKHLKFVLSAYVLITQ